MPSVDILQFDRDKPFGEAHLKKAIPFQMEAVFIRVFVASISSIYVPLMLQC